MSGADKPRSNQERAIHEYLESLLFEVPDDTEEPVMAPQTEEKEILPHDEPVVDRPVIGLDKLVAEIPETITETVTETITEVVTETVEEVQTVTELQPEKAEPIIPDWAETRFQCLLFKVSGLSLAVPLVKLNSVIPWDENITITPNQTEWYLGLIQHLNNQIKVIDTALLVMPENRRDKIEADTTKRLSHILLVDDYKWGLACDSIGDVIWLTKDDVKWRKDKSSRAWLSGTSLEHLCAIMDTEVFAEMLNKAS